MPPVPLIWKLSATMTTHLAPLVDLSIAPFSVMVGVGRVDQSGDVPGFGRLPADAISTPFVRFGS